MSSLRLALKQSLEESGQQAAQQREKERRQREEESRRRRKGEQRPVGQKKRGPGRPRKDGSSSLQSPHAEHRRRLTSGSTTGSSDHDLHYSDGGSSSSENEFSASSDNETKPLDTGEVAGKSVNDSTEHDGKDDHSEKRRKKMKKKRAMNRHRNSAANRIQSQWKKKKGNQLGDSVDAASSKQEKPDEHASVPKAKSPNVEKPKAATSSSSAKAKTVPPPSADIVSWINTLSVEYQRKNITAGLRVKVRFEMKKKRDGKLIRRRKWYGGLVTGVSKGGSKIRIKYDDGTTEVSKYPDEDVVVDAEGNGRHRVSDECFLPPLSSPREEETGSPTTRRRSTPTNDDDNDSRQRVDLKTESSRKDSATPKSSTPKLRVARLPHTEELQNSLDEETPSSAPVPTVEIRTARKTPSPTAGGILFSQSHDSSETSASPNHRDAADHAAQTTEHTEKIAKATEESMSKSVDDGSTIKETEDSYQNNSAADGDQSGLRVSPAEKSLEEEKPSAAEGIVEKKPTLTIRLMPPKADRDARRRSDAAIQADEDGEGSEDENDSSEGEKMSVQEEESHEGSTTAVPTTAGSVTAEEVKKAMKENSEVGTAGKDVVDSVDQVSGPKESDPNELPDTVLTGNKRPLPDAVDDDEPPAKKQTREWKNETTKELGSSPPPSSTTGMEQAVDAKASVDATETVGDVTSSENKEIAAPPHTEHEETKVKQRPSDSQPRASSASSEESSSSLPLQSHAKIKRKPDREGSSSARATDTGEERTSPPAADSPRPLSADLKQINDEGELSKPVSSLATPVELDSGEGSSRTKDDPVLTGSKNSAFDRKDSSVSGGDAEQSNLMPVSASGSDEEIAGRSATPLPQESKKGVAPTVPRSGRRAAQQANQRISSRQELVIQDPFAKAKRKREKLEAKTASEQTGKRKHRRDDADDDGRHWVQCDNCQKWRILPSTVETDKLPKHWYCEMNIYDSARNTCDAPEQTAEEEPSRKKKRGRRGRPRAETPIDTRETKQDKEVSPLPEYKDGNTDGAKERPSSRSPSLEKEGTGKVSKNTPRESPTKPKRSSPASAASTAETASPQSDIDSGAKGEPTKKQLLVGSSSTKKSKSNETEEGKNNPANEESAEVPAPKGKRGRKKAKDKEGKENEKGKSGKGSSKEEEAENQEWVQCEKCEKWRRLPPHISSEDLPEVWYCDMNTWDRASASCDVEEDKTDPNIREYNIFGTGQSSYGTSGKLSYRNLIFGTAGRRQNRPISERTRAAESLFSSVTDENSEGVGHPTVTYANSSAFVQRKSQTAFDDSGRVSFFDLMNHSNLWAELRGGRSFGSALTNGSHNHCEQPTRSFDDMTTETRRSLKDLVFHALGTGALAGHEVLLEAQCGQWESSREQWEELRACCTLDLVTRMLLELVQDGLVEVVREGDPQSSFVDKLPRYRRVASAPLETSSMTPPPERARSRCMKISKPWKNRQ